MSGKKKYTVEEKIQAAKRYIKGEASAAEIAAEMGMPASGCIQVRGWAANYRENGVEGFHLTIGNRSYTAAEKQKAVEEYLQEKGSLESICRKYHIPSHTTLRKWIKVYNSNRELRSYNPKPEVYVAMRRKTTLEERKEIVEYCLSHGKNYKETAAEYDVSYSQVYDWVKRYTKDRENGLEDRRGHHKADDEVDELERLRRENKRLKRQLEEQDMLVELLKKVKEFERM